MNFRIAWRATIAGLVLAATLSAPLPAHDDRHEGSGIEGVWLVSTQPRNCLTGDWIPNTAFEGLYTFHDDGTLSAWVQNATITTTRSPSHGVWKAKRRKGEHAVRFMHLRYNPTTGAYLGRQEAVGTIAVEAARDVFNADTTTTVFDVNGAVVTKGCAQSVGSRLSLPG
jgi:hypothetical protein